MFKRINQCDVYVGLWCIYMLQGVLYQPGIVNRILQLIMLLFGLIAILRSMFQSTGGSSILKAAFVLIIMYTIYGSINIMFGDSLTPSNHYSYGRYVYLQAALNSLAPIFLFYYSAMDGKLTNDRIRIYLPILIVICILLYYKNESIKLLDTNKDGMTNNIGYMFITLIPFLFFYSKKPILQHLLMGIILLYVFMGMKRGAILIATITSVVLLYANVKNSSRWMKVLFTILSITVVVGISKYIDYMMDNSSYFMERFEQTMDGNSSNRDIIYRSLWNALSLESSPFYFYFGRGADSTVKVIGTFAHQYWLETFCNNGLIGVIILFYFFYTFGKNTWKSRYYFPRMMFYSFVTLFITILSKTFFSMSIKALELSESMLLGYFAFELHNLELDDINETEY